MLGVLHVVFASNRSGQSVFDAVRLPMLLELELEFCGGAEDDVKSID